MVIYQVGIGEKATKNQPHRQSVSKEFSSRGAAEEYQRELEKAGYGRSGGEYLFIRVKPTVPLPIDPRSGSEVVRPKLSESEVAREEVKKELHREKLVEQAIEKAEEGKQISTAEKEALKRVEKLTYTIAGSTVTGTGKSFVARLEAGKEAATKLQEGKKLTGLEAGTIGALEVAKYKETEKRIAEVVPKLKFETEAEIKAAGYEVAKPKEVDALKSQDVGLIQAPDLVRLGTEGIIKKETEQKYIPTPSGFIREAPPDLRKEIIPSKYEAGEIIERIDKTDIKTLLTIPALAIENLISIPSKVLGVPETTKLFHEPKFYEGVKSFYEKTRYGETKEQIEYRERVIKESQKEGVTGLLFLGGAYVGGVIRRVIEKPITSAAEILTIGGATKLGGEILQTMKVKTTPIKYDVYGKEAVIKTVQTKPKVKVVRIEPLDIKGTIGKEKFTVTGFGEAKITQIPKQQQIKGIYKFETYFGEQKPIVTDVGLMGKVTQTKTGLRGYTITEAITKKISEKAITPYYGRKLKGQVVPTTVSFSGIFIKGKGGLPKPIFGGITLTRKYPYTPPKGFPYQVEYFRAKEVGLEAKGIKIYKATKTEIPKIRQKAIELIKSKKGQVTIFKPQIIEKPKPKPSKLMPESILSSSFFKEMGRAIKSAYKSRLGTPRGIWIPLISQEVTGAKPIIKPISITEAKPITEVRPITETRAITEVRPITETRAITEVRPITETRAITEVRPITETRAITEVRPITETRAITEVRPITTLTTVPPLLPPKPPITKEKELIRGYGAKEQAYDVYIREGEKRGDRFRKVASKLPKNKAIRKGRDIVDRYIEASFRIKKLKEKTKERDLLFSPDLSKFRRPRKKSKLPYDTFIELKKHRLDTPSEVKQISYFKELAQRKKQIIQGFIKSRKKQISRRKKQNIRNAIIGKQKQINFISSKTDSNSFFKTKKKKRKGGF